MSLLHALVLGVLQGLTEFLPVSSSGHLIVIPKLFGWEEQPLAFDVAIHQGTTLAVLLYFWRDFVQLARCGTADIVMHRLRWGAYSPLGRLALLIVLGCVPAVIAGGLGNTWIEEHLRNPWLIAGNLVLFGLVMLAADRWAQPSREMDKLNPPRALLIGCAQALALIPGISRSGSTIAAGMFSGLRRDTAARFSFLLSAPIVVAAGIKELPDIRTAADGDVGTAALALGFAGAFLSGISAIHLLLRYVARHPLSIFVWYRVALAVLIIVTLGR